MSYNGVTRLATVIVCTQKILHISYSNSPPPNKEHPNLNFNKHKHVDYNLYSAEVVSVVFQMYDGLVSIPDFDLFRTALQ